DCLTASAEDVLPHRLRASFPGPGAVPMTERRGRSSVGERGRGTTRSSHPPPGSGSAARPVLRIHVVHRALRGEPGEVGGEGGHVPFGGRGRYRGPGGEAGHGGGNGGGARRGRRTRPRAAAQPRVQSCGYM